MKTLVFHALRFGKSCGISNIFVQHAYQVRSQELLHAEEILRSFEPVMLAGQEVVEILQAFIRTWFGDAGCEVVEAPKQDLASQTGFGRLHWFGTNGFEQLGSQRSRRCIRCSEQQQIRECIHIAIVKPLSYFRILIPIVFVPF